jgi:hypothetical protein
MSCRALGTLAIALVLLGGGPACEATQPKQVEDPDPLGLGTGELDVDGDSDSDISEESDSDAREATADAQGDSAPGKPAEPAFSDNMSVDEAINAVPPDAERLNIEQERLAEPLQQPELYEPCKLGSGHFRARVAVWNGRAVGVDVETQPKSPALAKCIDSQIRQVKWSDKVRSLNTVEYSY